MPSTLEKIEDYIFDFCDSLTSVTFLTESTYKWQVTESATETSGTDVQGLTFGENATEEQKRANATALKTTYAPSYWIRVTANA